MIQKFIFLTLLSTMISVTAFAQLRFGIRGGFNDINAKGDPLTVIDQTGKEVLEVALDRTKTGLLGGLVIQAKIGRKFVFQPELLLSSSNYEYQVVDLTDPSIILGEKKESFRYFDIPVLLGWHFGPLRLQAGPSAHIHVNSASDLVDLDFYRENIDNFTFGWLGNIGLDIWSFMLDVRYEGNLTRFGNSFQVGNTVFQFDERPSRWVFSIGYLF